MLAVMRFNATTRAIRRPQEKKLMEETKLRDAGQGIETKEWKRMMKKRTEKRNKKRRVESYSE